MTPAINSAKKQKIPFSIHKYKHDPKHASYGLEAVEKLGLPPKQVFKTLVVQLDSNELAVAIIPVQEKLNLKLFAKSCGAKKAEMADGALVSKTTGYVLGGVSPMGQKKKLKTFLHSSAQQHQTIYVSAGKRGLEIELNPADLLRLTDGNIFQAE